MISHPPRKKKEILKAAREKHVAYKGKITVTVDFSSVITEARRRWHIFQVLNEKNCQPRIYQKYPSGMQGGQLKIFSGEVKRSEFVSSRPTLKEWLKEVPETKKMIKEGILKFQDR